MLKTTFMGRLGRDAVIRESQNGTRFLSFVGATNSKIRGAEKTTWVNVISFNERHMGNLKTYLTKGSHVVVIGDLDASNRVGEDGKTYLDLTITADSIDFANTGTGQTNNESSDNSKPAKPTPEVPEHDTPVVSSKKSTKKAPVDIPEPDDDLPF